MSLLSLGILYFVGMVFAYGLRGGVRDEMEGIADLFVIALWPIALVGWLLYRILSMIASAGAWCRRMLQ